MATPRRKQTQEKAGFEVIAVRVEATLRRQLEDMAKSDERTISQLARIALREFIERKNGAVAA